MIYVHHVEPGAPILGSNGVRIGFVDSVEGDRIKLGDRDESGVLDDRARRFIPFSLIDHVENGMVWLRTKSDEVVSFEAGATTYSNPPRT